MRLNKWITSSFSPFPTGFSVIEIQIQNSASIQSTQVRKCILLIPLSLSRFRSFCPGYWWHACGQIQWTHQWFNVADAPSFLKSSLLVTSSPPHTNSQALLLVALPLLSQPWALSQAPSFLYIPSLGDFTQSVFLNNTYRIWWHPTPHLRLHLFPEPELEYLKASLTSHLDV